MFCKHTQNSIIRVFTFGESRDHWRSFVIRPFSFCSALTLSRKDRQLERKQLILPCLPLRAKAATRSCAFRSMSISSSSCSHTATSEGTSPLPLHLSYPSSIVHAVEALLRSQPDIKTSLYEELKSLRAAGGSSSSSDVNSANADNASFRLTPNDEVLINMQIDMYYLPVFAYLKNLCDAKLTTKTKAAATRQPLHGSPPSSSPSPSTETPTAATGSQSNHIGDVDGDGDGDGDGGAVFNPVYVGISAPQGCGKTTMTDIMVRLFAKQGVHAVALSLDDFYLRGAGTLCAAALCFEVHSMDF
jgi:hypothetical protein